MHSQLRSVAITVAALLMWAAPASATRHGGEIPIAEILLLLVAMPTVFPLVPVVCGMAVQAAMARRFLAAAIIGASGGAAAWATYQLMVTRDLLFDEAMPRIGIGIGIGIGFWGVDVVRRAAEPMWLVGRAAIGWVICAAIALAMMALKVGSS